MCWNIVLLELNILVDERQTMTLHKQWDCVVVCNILTLYLKQLCLAKMGLLKISELLACRKQLKDFFNTTLLHDTVLRILDTFMSLGSPHHWLGFLMPEHFKLYNSAATFSSGNTEPSPSSKFEQLMLEARTVLSRYFCLFFPLCCKTRFSLVYQVHH